MSARRQARARDVAEVVSMVGGAPAVLLIGRCIEVWTAPDMHPPSWSAVRRFNAASQAWRDKAGVNVRELWGLVPHGAPWSIDHVGQENATQRLARADMTLADLPRLQREARRLLEGH